MLDIDPQLPRDFLLLVNARPEKGFSMLLAVAGALPEVNFVAIASQSDAPGALRDLEERGIENVTIIDKVGDMQPLYRACKAVMVPSYDFVETFSRVCIEAHRFGKPVLGADTGNIPFLLKQSGVVLPRDPHAWISAIKRMFGDSSYYAELAHFAKVNSARYSPQRRNDALLNIVSHSKQRMLIGIGSGIGNMLHVGPMIRNIANRTGHPVDLVVSEDHSETLFLLQNTRYVNAVWSLGEAVLSRHYHTVFITHSFGGARVNFRGDKVVWARDWEGFEPGRSAHETEYNLQAARELLGIEYDPDDRLGHYVGNFGYRPQKGGIVGFHGGSKGGYWSSKRWGGFPDLAGQLKAEGYEVRSFGIASEYVPGTDDFTGGTVEEMVEKLCECSYFVSNDSGVMNIANGLGIPLIGLFGPTEVRTRGPLGRFSRSLSVERDCAPCEVKNKEHFKSGACTCIDSISVSEVYSLFKSLVADVDGDKNEISAGIL